MTVFFWGFCVYWDSYFFLANTFVMIRLNFSARVRSEFWQKRGRGNFKLLEKITKDEKCLKIFSRFLLKLF